MTTAEFEQFQALVKDNRLTEALQLAENQCMENRNPFWLTQQAKVLNRQKKYRQALERAKEAVHLDSINHYAILAAADALFGLKEFEEAADYYREIAHAPKISGIALKKYLECLAKAKKWEVILEETAKMESGEEEVYTLKIEALVHLHRDDEAVKICKQWLKNKPGYAPALRQLVELEIKRDGIEKVKSNMARMAQIPSLPPIYKEIYASLCQRTGDQETAGKQLDELQAKSSDPWIQKRKAYHLAKTGKEEEALPLLEELLRLEPEETYLHASYAAACKRIGRLEQALSFYQQLQGKNPDARSLYGRIAKIKKQLGSSR